MKTVNPLEAYLKSLEKVLSLAEHSRRLLKLETKSLTVDRAADYAKTTKNLDKEIKRAVALSGKAHKILKHHNIP